MNTGELLKKQYEDLMQEYGNKVQTLAELTKEIKEHEHEITRLKELMNFYFKPESNSDNENLSSEEIVESKKIYIKWRRRVIECLKNNDRLMTTGEILDYTWPTVTSDTRKKLIANLSSALFGMCNDGQLKKYEEYEGRGNLYGLPEWFNGEEPLPAYKPTSRSGFIDLDNANLNIY